MPVLAQPYRRRLGRSSDTAPQTTTKPRSGWSELVKRALAAAKDQDLKFVLVIDKLGTGDPYDFTAMMMSGDTPLPKPLVMKRLYLDGHEELVRAGTFGGLQLRTLKNLLAIGQTAVPYHYLASGPPRRFDAFGDLPTGFGVSIVCPCAAVLRSRHQEADRPAAHAADRAAAVTRPLTAGTTGRSRAPGRR